METAVAGAARTRREGPGLPGAGLAPGRSRRGRVAPARYQGPGNIRLEDVERLHILRVLEQACWRIRGLEAAAAILDLTPTTLESRMATLGIRRPG